ncbi:hypothetical protein PTKIN_Ptkin14bG0092700 [Pterospermum kingtungense]
MEMEEISKEQESIKEGQRQVREKFEAIEGECEQLRKQTNKIIQQSANTQIRLALMFNILRAREEGDFAKATHLTQLLRLGELERILRTWISSKLQNFGSSSQLKVSNDLPELTIYRV